MNDKGVELLMAEIRHFQARPEEHGVHSANRACRQLTSEVRFRVVVADSSDPVTGITPTGEGPAGAKWGAIIGLHGAA
jgi:hypothetical protein